jgi:hypothetical protein
MPGTSEPRTSGWGYVSSTMVGLADERAAARRSIERLRLIEDEYRLAVGMPKLVNVQHPAPERAPRSPR